MTPETETPMSTNEQKHTKEPWYYQEESDAYTHIIRAEKFTYVGGLSNHSNPHPEADARRIVACVNALAGIPDPATALPAAVLALEELLDMILPCNAQAPSMRDFVECPEGHEDCCGRCSAMHEATAALAAMKGVQA